jgi:serine/threonine-protein kinase
MGTVFLAEDKQNNNINCVIKQMNNKYGDEAERNEAIRLFRREADILRSLNHPGIVRVFDSYAEVESGRYFLVMDYVPGKNLETIVNTNGALSSELAVRIAIQCCDVLEYLHTSDPPIIYRDLKPSNLMLRPDGRIVFIDFGIARSFMPKDVATRVVTAGYSPPEQYFGKPETRSDLYSLGATISHLVTGSRPKPLTTCNPALVNNTVMPTLNALVMKLTAHDVEDRPPSAQATRFALYKIYKELHPEFAIPEMPDNSAYEKEELRRSLEMQAAQGQLRPGPRVSSGHRIISASGSHDIMGAESGGQKAVSEPGRPSIMERLKRFISQLR